MIDYIPIFLSSLFNNKSLPCAEYISRYGGRISGYRIKDKLIYKFKDVQIYLTFFTA